MKTATILATIVLIGGSVGAFAWLPGALVSVQKAINKPVLEAIEKQSRIDRSIMFSMKDYDIRTDELNDDVMDLEAQIQILEREMEETQDISKPHKRSLERRIKSDKKKLKKKGDALHRATIGDQKILAALNRKSF